MRKFPRLPQAALKPPKGFKVPRVQDLRADMNRLAQEIAEDFKETIVHNIESNEYGFTLKQKTILRKGSDIPLIDEKELVDAIYREGTTVSVDDTPRSDSSLSNLEMAMVHEYGTKDKHIPSRPIWRKTYRDFREDAVEIVEDFLNSKGVYHANKAVQKNSKKG